MFILCLSTSTARGSVALLSDEAVVAARSYLDERRHAERLFEELDALLAEAAVSRSQLDVIACDVGPGSFTGTRVGLAAAKGIAHGLGVPLWPACSLRAMALAAFTLAGEAAGALIMPCVDAKRGEIFHAVYDRQLREVRTPAQACQAALIQLLSTRASEGVVSCGQILDQLPEPAPRHLHGDAFALPDASWLGRLAQRDFASVPAPPLAFVEPIYVRDVDAIPNLPPAPVLSEPS